MDNKNNYYTCRQLRADLTRMLEFVRLQLSRTLSPTEEAYYRGRKFCLEEITRLAKHMRDPEEIPERTTQ